VPAVLLPADYRAAMWAVWLERWSVVCTGYHCACCGYLGAVSCCLKYIKICFYKLIFPKYIAYCLECVTLSPYLRENYLIIKLYSHAKN
jgi:hypothetical protein